MNLALALGAALPDVSSQLYRETYFRFDPKTPHYEEKHGDKVSIIVLVSKSRRLFTFTPEQWKLVQLFDGRRSYPQIATLWRRTCRVVASTDAIRSFAEMLDNGDFWHKTPQEESIAVLDELMQDRRSCVKRKEPRSVTRMYLWVRDSDREVTWAYRKLKAMYQPGFVLFSLAAIVVMLCLWLARWNVIFNDSLQYWNMAKKTLGDVGEFYLLFFLVGFVHESGHALTAKHFGAGVHRTGVMLVYTIPCFFVNLAEVWVAGGRWVRIAAALGGFWFEAMLCCIATVFWWGTAVGSPAHDLAYKFILVGGIMPVLFNLNPLVPLDGYLVMGELIRVQGLKEKSNRFLSLWVQNRIFKLPVTVPVLSRKRATLFTVYGLLGGLYTYSMMLFLARLTYRLVHNYSTQWAFLPAALVALLVFKSRIAKLATFLKTLYLDKKDLMLAHKTQVTLAAAAVLMLLFLPLRHESIEARFILIPDQRAVVRAEVPGRVEQVLVREGNVVTQGSPLMLLDNLLVQSETAKASSEVQLASAHARTAQLQYADVAAPQSELRKRLDNAQVAGVRERRLLVESPIVGTVVTPHPEDLLDTFVGEGATLVEIHNESVLRARIFVDESDMRTLTEITGVSLKLPSRLQPLRGQFLGISTTAQDPSPGLLEMATKYKGLQPPPHYVATVLVSNSDGSLRSGMSGEAKIFGKRRSLAGLLSRPILNFVGRKFW